MIGLSVGTAFLRVAVTAGTSVHITSGEHMKPYFLIKENLFAAALFFYVYTHAYPSFEQTVQEILARKRAAKIEANLTYFVKCTEVKDPIIVFNPEFFPLWDEVKNCYCLALSEDCAGFSCDKDVGSVLRKMFTTALEIPKEEEIEEQIHIPSEEVSIESPRRAFLGYVVESVVKKVVKKKKSLFPSRCSYRARNTFREDENREEFSLIDFDQGSFDQ